jgi:hypothetical protein
VGGVTKYRHGISFRKIGKCNALEDFDFSEMCGKVWASITYGRFVKLNNMVSCI